MATLLEDLVEPLKREVAVPGTFTTTFPETTDDDLSASLLDAFAQAQLDGFFATYSVTDDGAVTPDLSRGGTALVVIYAGIRFLQADLLNRKTHIHYAAGGAVFEQDQGASILVEALKGLRAKKDALILLAQNALRASIGVTMVDGYIIKAVDFETIEMVGALGYGGYMGGGAYGRVLGN